MVCQIVENKMFGNGGDFRLILIRPCGEPGEVRRVRPLVRWPSPGTVIGHIDERGLFLE
jgi:hypothetical protein